MSNPDEHRCFICGKPFKAGEMVLPAGFPYEPEGRP